MAPRWLPPAACPGGQGSASGPSPGSGWLGRDPAPQGEKERRDGRRALRSRRQTIATPTQKTAQGTSTIRSLPVILLSVASGVIGCSPLAGDVAQVKLSWRRRGAVRAQPLPRRPPGQVVALEGAWPSPVVGM